MTTSLLGRLTNDFVAFGGSLPMTTICCTTLTNDFIFVDDTDSGRFIRKSLLGGGVPLAPADSHLFLDDGPFRLFFFLLEFPIWYPWLHESISIQSVLCTTINEQ